MLYVPVFVDEIMCDRTYDVACWPETKAGNSFTQDCPFLLFRSGGNRTFMFLWLLLCCFFFALYSHSLNISF